MQKVGRVDTGRVYVKMALIGGAYRVHVQNTALSRLRSYAS